MCAIYVTVNDDAVTRKTFALFRIKNKITGIISGCENVVYRGYCPKRIAVQNNNEKTNAARYQCMEGLRAKFKPVSFRRRINFWSVYVRCNAENNDDVTTKS